MNLVNKVLIKYITANEPQLPAVIRFSIGNPTEDKILDVIRNYHASNHKVLGAFINDILIGIVGFLASNQSITLKHISVLPNFQRKGLGTLILDYIKEHYYDYVIAAETDEESVMFYIKSGFICNSFIGKYGNLRYKCVLINNVTY